MSPRYNKTSFHFCFAFHVNRHGLHPSRLRPWLLLLGDCTVGISVISLHFEKVVYKYQPYLQRRTPMFIYFNRNTMDIIGFSGMVTTITWLLPLHTRFTIISKGSSIYAKSSCKGILSLMSLRLYLSILFLLMQGQDSKQLILNISIKSKFFLWGPLINHISLIYLTTLCSILFMQLLK